jgi:hypothetical protein
LSLVYWVLTAVIMVAASISTLLGGHPHPGIVLFSVILGAGFVGAFHANAVGFTGEPFILEALALPGRRELRSYFSGQDIVLGVIAVPLLAAASFAWPPRPGTRRKASWPWRWDWPGSARRWAWPTSSPSPCPIPWPSGPAAPCPSPPRDPGAPRSRAIRTKL